MNAKVAVEHAAKTFNNVSVDLIYAFHGQKITDSWANIQGEGSILTTHNHPNAVISGVIYLKCVVVSNFIDVTSGF